MAEKEKKKVLTPDEQKAEQERLAREKKEEDELKKKHAEKIKLKKEKAARIKKKHKKEEKRVKSLINLPFKLLSQISLLITLFCFITLFFGLNKPINDTILYSFFVFILLYVGIGTIMVGMFFLVSEDKIVEMEEMKKVELERLKMEKTKEEEELAHMVELEKEITSKKLAGKFLRENSPEIYFNDNEDFSDNSSMNSDLDFISSGIDSKSSENSDDIDLNEQQFMYSENDLNPYGEEEELFGSNSNQDLFELEMSKEENDKFGFENFEFDTEKV